MELFYSRRRPTRSLADNFEFSRSGNVAPTFSAGTFYSNFPVNSVKGSEARFLVCGL